MNKMWISILIAGMSLGTAWAIRGQFGHEQGAAWAGGIGALAIVLLAQRRDWYSKAYLIALSSATGWGAGGMISYGMVVGYGRSDDFLNAAYGLVMLFVIGSLFGLLGGGLTGLTLQSSSQKPVRWGNLIAEMAAGGLIGYHLLIGQLELLMTPPRSEAWAVCFGAALAMVWHMARNGYVSPLRVSYITAMGAGFGFAFGNFLQITGNVLEINFNMWNVMEYSIGFFGGTAMAYGIFTSDWPEESAQPAKWEIRSAYIIMFVLIPLIVYINSPLGESLFSSGEDASVKDIVTSSGRLVSFLSVVSASLLAWLITIRKGDMAERKKVMWLLSVYLGTYIIISYCSTGAFSGVFHLNHHLYVANMVIVLFLLTRNYPAFSGAKSGTIEGGKWLLIFVVLLLVILLLALVAINMHDVMNGARSRFPVS